VREREFVAGERFCGWVDGWMDVRVHDSEVKLTRPYDCMRFSILVNIYDIYV